MLGFWYGNPSSGLSFLTSSTGRQMWMCSRWEKSMSFSDFYPPQDLLLIFNITTWFKTNNNKTKLKKKNNLNGLFWVNTVFQISCLFSLEKDINKKLWELWKNQHPTLTSTCPLNWISFNCSISRNYFLWCRKHEAPGWHWNSYKHLCWTQMQWVIEALKKAATNE